MSSNVLVITSKEDVTVDFVITKLKERNIEYYRFNTEDIGSCIDVYFDGTDYSLRDKKKDKQIDLNLFTSIYFRRPKVPLPLAGLTLGEQRFYLTEITTYLEGLYRSLLGKYWLNSVFDIRMLENKPYQLSLANELELAVPNLSITNDYSDSLTFAHEHKNCIFKPLKSGLINEAIDKGKILYTTKIDSHFLDNIESHGRMPLYLQKEIEKDSDIRVTVVGNKIFSAKISSQELEVSKVDWRKSESMLSHKRINLPKQIEEKCLLLCAKFNLDFAAIDFILDKSGNFWFLEINPNGQWAWIESLLNYPISDEIVNLLLSRGQEC